MALALDQHDVAITQQRPSDSTDQSATSGYATSHTQVSGGQFVLSGAEILDRVGIVGIAAVRRQDQPETAVPAVVPMGVYDARRAPVLPRLCRFDSLAGLGY
jgi:hypothetical protein